MTLRRIAALLAGLGMVTSCTTTSQQQPSLSAVETSVQSRIDASRLDAGHEAETRGDYPSAQAYYRAAYERDKKNIDAGLGLSRMLRRLGRPREAVAISERLLEVDKNNPKVMAELGKSQLAANDTLDAIETLSRAGSFLPDDWEIQSALGVGYDRIGMYDQAAHRYKNALSLAPNHPVVLNNYALSLAQIGKLDQAISLLEKATVMPERTAQMRQNLALLYAVAGRIKDAERLVRQDLSPEVAAENIAYYRKLAARSTRGVPRLPADLPAPTPGPASERKPDAGNRAVAERAPAAPIPAVAQTTLAPADSAPAERAPAERARAEAAPVTDVSAKDAPAKDAPAKGVPAANASAPDASTSDASAPDASAGQSAPAATGSGAAAAASSADSGTMAPGEAVAAPPAAKAAASSEAATTITSDEAGVPSAAGETKAAPQMQPATPTPPAQEATPTAALAQEAPSSAAAAPQAEATTGAPALAVAATGKQDRQDATAPTSAEVAPAAGQGAAPTNGGDGMQTSTSMAGQPIDLRPKPVDKSEVATASAGPETASASGSGPRPTAEATTSYDATLAAPPREHAPAAAQSVDVPAPATAGRHDQVEKPGEGRQPAVTVARATAPAAAPAQPAAKTAGPVYRVQLGSYRKEADASHGIAMLRAAHGDILAELDLGIVPVTLADSGNYFRILTQPLASRDDAAGICRELQDRDVSCFVRRDDH